MDRPRNASTSSTSGDGPSRLPVANPASHKVQAASDIVTRIAGPHVGSAWLFGSRARGDHREDSDWDVAVVVGPSAPWRSIENRLRDEAAAHWSRTGERIQFHVVARDNVRRMGVVTRAVEAEGVLL